MRPTLRTPQSRPGPGDARGPAVRLVTWGWEEAVAVRWSRVYTPRDGVHVLSMYVGWSMVLMCHVGCQSNTSS